LFLLRTPKNVGLLLKVETSHLMLVSKKRGFFGFLPCPGFLPPIFSLRTQALIFGGSFSQQTQIFLLPTFLCFPLVFCAKFRLPRKIFCEKGWKPWQSHRINSPCGEKFPLKGTSRKKGLSHKILRFKLVS